MTNSPPSNRAGRPSGRTQPGGVPAYDEALAVGLTAVGSDSGMPSAGTLESFIAKVESNAHAEAIEQFYAPDASMQENDKPPRVGRDALAAHERKVLARMRTVRSRCVRPVFVNGDFVVVRWVFEFEALDGARTRIEELAYQRWEGERVAEEKFFYDPGQLAPRE